MKNILTPATLFASFLLFISCSVVPKETAKLTGLQTLAEWKSQLASIDKSKTSRDKYENAKSKVNSLIDPVLHSKVDSVESQSLAGIGSTIDLSNEAIIDPSTKVSVENYLSSNSAFGGGGSDIGVQIGGAILQWAAGAASESRTKSADTLKKKLDAYQWPQWNSF